MWEISAAILGLLIGGWMVFDGLHVLRKGKYFGPEKPGGWARLPQKFGFDPFRMGPVFVGLGIFWLGCALGMIVAPQLVFWPMVTVAALSLWYIKIGTAFSVLVLILLMGQVMS